MWGMSQTPSTNSELSLSVGKIVSDFSVGMRESATTGRGPDFVGYRRFKPSDTSREIAWRASGRLPDQDDIISQDFEPEREMRLVVFADESVFMLKPEVKPQYAQALVRLYALAAEYNGDPFAIVGIGGESMIYSGWLHKEDELDEFLAAADDKRQRREFQCVSHLPELLHELDPKNMLMVFLTDLASKDRIPFKAIRDLDPEKNNIQCVAVVLDEWSHFEPVKYSIVFEHIQNGRTSSLDMRPGSGIDREVQVFRKSLAELRRRGKSINLPVITVPLADEKPLGSFTKQWERYFETG
jgi:uncharacterized protein (DUF58 family)